MSSFRRPSSTRIPPTAARVVAKSAQFRFRPKAAKTPPAPLLLLSPPNPLRWASAGAPFFCRLTLQSSTPPTGACIWCSNLGVCTSNGAPHQSALPFQARRLGRRHPSIRTQEAGGRRGNRRSRGFRTPVIEGRTPTERGYPGGPPPGHALWVLSLVQEKVPRLSGRDPTSQRACRNPPAKRYPVRRATLSAACRRRKAPANSPCFSPGKRVK